MFKVKWQSISQYGMSVSSTSSTSSGRWTKRKPTLTSLSYAGSKEKTVAWTLFIICGSTAIRAGGMSLTEEYYLLWVGLAFNTQNMAVNYDPSGSVKCMDVLLWQVR
ncbi:predicted protein [Histoplasma capsulatum G186AR]|uniref:Uncharacterized protein n=1 Tax=Ajellomyces capsulatus (strain G186AR / H82 / ATCC MYA-2454 / RMSCC 2432) TaxID=447093 RepID=C0NPE0_AJECG|nr:uncharacterized protein HCBG_05020 [Histoplasma capsulatum G186AR]EEH06800.1 predicted protein [Histoplasma capsulatum G186AR]